jgi:8-oxo-dGTP diphosphatase
VPVYVVRHADALSRSDWEQPDEIRPLTKRGVKQAEGIADRLAGLDVRRVLSSPSLRCRHTVAPLAERVGVEVEIADELLEGATGARAAALAESLAKRKSGVVLCSHGDVIPDLLRVLMGNGLRLSDEFKWAKGSVWALEWDGTHFVEGRYQPPTA